MKDGVLVIRKEEGYTSHDVVAKLRGILHMKRIGHTGTLDPAAVGVLPVVLGKATKLSEFLTDKQKTYEAVLRLGVVTDTQDMTGTVLETNSVEVTKEQLVEVLESFLGEQEQIPPMYSALKVDGKKLYELAREGKEIERKARPVCFYDISILDCAFPLVRFSVTCSRGTYIRTLCHDIGQKLGCGGCMEELKRTKSGVFTLEESLTLDEVRALTEEGTLDSHIHEIEEILSEYPRVCVKEEADRFLRNGNCLVPENFDSECKDSCVRVCLSDGTFLGLYEWNVDRYKPLKMFI